jgi:hypothetical protein
MPGRVVRQAGSPVLETLVVETYERGIDTEVEMSPVKNPWLEINEQDRTVFANLADSFAPAIRIDPKDLGINLRGHYRIAILRGRKHISRIQIAYHYLWDTPTMDDIKRIRPDFVPATIKRYYERFLHHIEKWGPGDIELVKATFQRKPEAANLDAIDPTMFFMHEIKYRTGAHKKGVWSQITKGIWYKLGYIPVSYIVPNEPFEYSNGRLVLTVDSTHHSFFKPGETFTKKVGKWPIVLPGFSYFPESAWRDFSVSENDRGAEDWESA